MPLTQVEPDTLLKMPKEFSERDPLDFPRTQPLAYVRTLRSVDRREEFLFDFERGRRNRARLKYQTRARRVVILTRLDLDGPAHRNPPNATYLPGHRLLCPHFHQDRAGFDDRVAWRVADVAGLALRDPANGVFCLEDFLRYCAVQNPPNIQLTV